MNAIPCFSWRAPHAGQTVQFSFYRIDRPAIAGGPQFRLVQLVSDTPAIVGVYEEGRYLATVARVIERADCTIL